MEGRHAIAVYGLIPLILLCLPLSQAETWITADGKYFRFNISFLLFVFMYQSIGIIPLAFADNYKNVFVKERAFLADLELQRIVFGDTFVRALQM